MDLGDREREQVERFIASHIELTSRFVKENGMDSRLAYFAVSAAMENARLHALRVGITALELNAIEANARQFVRVVHGAYYSTRENADRST